MDNLMTPIGKDQPFRFACNKNVSCFNACCRDLNQTLMPYDILRLKHHLRLSSGAFLEQYAHVHIGPETGLPIVTLRPDTAKDKCCPFVTAQGCRVYNARPASCRIYPVARAISQNRKTGRVSEHFALLKEPHCHGFSQTTSQTVREWARDQGFDAYSRYNDLLMEIISLKNRLIPGPLDLRRQRLFQLALYDIDAFREHLFIKGLATGANLDHQTVERLKKDDEALLTFGHDWVKKELFGKGGIALVLDPGYKID